MNEFELIHRYFQWPPQRADVALAGGDDAAVVRLAPDEQLVVSTDTLNAGVHFPHPCPPEKLAARALRSNLSDLAAMGAEPRWYSLALSLPEVDEDWLAGFSRGLREESRHWQVDLVGGDTTRGPLSIGIQIMGVAQGRWLQRNGARIGDLVLVTGTLGDAAAYLQAASAVSSSAAAFFAQRFWYPQPRLDFARRAVGLIHAACDISDGLGADLAHICDASGVGAELEVAQLPLSAALRELEPGHALDLALSGGDDYELCLAAPPAHLDQLQAIAADCGVALTQVGRFTAGQDVQYRDAQGRALQPRSGYLHFP